MSHGLCGAFALAVRLNAYYAALVFCTKHT